MGKVFRFLVNGEGGGVCDSSRKKRETLSLEQKEVMNANERRRKESQRTSLYYKEAHKSQEIMEGNYSVSTLQLSPDNIGGMDEKCPFCKAFKFRKETGST